MNPPGALLPGVPLPLHLFQFYLLLILKLRFLRGIAFLLDLFLVLFYLAVRKDEDCIVVNAGEGVLADGLQFGGFDGDLAELFAAFEGSLADGGDVLSDGYGSEFLQALAGGAFDLGDLVGLAVCLDSVFDGETGDVLVRDTGEGGIAAVEDIVAVVHVHAVYLGV